MRIPKAHIYIYKHKVDFSKTLQLNPNYNYTIFFHFINMMISSVKGILMSDFLTIEINFKIFGDVNKV